MLTNLLEDEARTRVIEQKVLTNQRIALLIDTASSWGAGLIEGIANYAKVKKKRWIFSIEPRGKYDRVMLPDSWRGDGVIARVAYSELAWQLINTKIPAVNVSWFRHGEHLIPSCTCDEEAVAKMAVDYFIGNGFRQFAYCPSTLRPSYYDRLGVAFVDALKEHGYYCEQFSVPENREEYDKLDAEQQLQSLSDWLSSLPRLTALLTFDDFQGRQVNEACALRGISVPDDIAVLGGEHDELSSRIASPSLSGIDHAPQEVGYRAAEMLDMQMNGQELKETNIQLPPRRIITRQSTDQVAIPDDLLVQAIEYIRTNYSSELRIRDILQAIPLSRRGLELGFRKYLNRTPREEIRRIRVEKAIELLCDTEWPVTKIALHCGFDRPEILTRAFRKEVDTTPTEFRRRILLKSSGN